MSNKKMIIRNCPCFVEGIAIKGNEQKTQTCNNHKVRELTLCQDCTDCIMKQIVEKCKDAQSECSCKNAIKDVDCFECTSGGRAELGTEILQLLQIEEVE